MNKAINMGGWFLSHLKPSSAAWGIIAGGALLATSSQAGTFTWNGTASKNWSGANWNEGAPLNDGTDDIHMAGTNRLSNRANGGWDINSLSFDAGAGQFIINGFSTEEILLEAGGIVNNSTNLQTVNQPLLLNANQSWTAASGDLSIGATVNIFNFGLTLDGAHDTTIGGVISGNGTIIKNGAGILTLSGANAFAGGLTVNAGTLIAGNGTAFGTGPLSLGGGSALQASGGDQVFANSLVMAGAATFSGTNNITFSGPVSGSGALTKDGAANLTLTGNNTYSGAVTVNGGTLVAGGQGALGSVASITVNNASLQLANVGAGAINPAAPLTFSGATLLANNQTEKFGNLNLTSSSAISFIQDAIHGTLEFAGLNITSGAILSVHGWSGDFSGGTDDIFKVDTDPGATVLGDISFDGFSQGAVWNSVTFELTPVPEPNTLALLGLGFVGTLALRRRRSA